jgi:hypothetical protein
MSIFHCKNTKSFSGLVTAQAVDPLPLYRASFWYENNIGVKRLVEPSFKDYAQSLSFA